MVEAFPYVDGVVNSTDGDDPSNIPLETYANLSHSKKVFTRRWYILIVYGFAALLQGFIWNMWGPIFDSMNFVYGWSPRQLALLPFYGTVTFSILVIPSALFLEAWGLRKLLIVMSGLVAISSVVKCIPGPDAVITTFVNLSAILNGLAGSVTFFVPAYISAHWFSAHERKLATTIGTMFSGLGVALPFVAGPGFVSEPEPGIGVESMRHQYMVFTYTLAGVSCAILVAIVSYFPNKPPLPPTDSALVKRLHFGAGFKQLVKLKSFWCLCASSVLLLGTYGGWTSILVLDLARQNVDEVEAGWLGFYAFIAGLTFAIVIGFVADRFGNLKSILIALTVLSIESSLWLLLILHGYLSFSLRGAYVAIIISSISTTSSWAIRFELASELCYPVDESISVGVLGLLVNVLTSLFLSVLFVDGVGTVWIDWFLVIGSITSLPFLIFMKASYKRTEMDDYVALAD